MLLMDGLNIAVNSLFINLVVFIIFQSFLPKTYEILIQNKIKIVSARSGYEDKYPGDTTKWKNEAFLKLKDSFDKTVWNSI